MPPEPPRLSEGTGADFFIGADDDVVSLDGISAGSCLVFVGTAGFWATEGFCSWADGKVRCRFCLLFMLELAIIPYALVSSAASSPAELSEARFATSESSCRSYSSNCQRYSGTRDRQHTLIG